MHKLFWPLFLEYTRAVWICYSRLLSVSHHSLFNFGLSFSQQLGIRVVLQYQGVSFLSMLETHSDQQVLGADKRLDLRFEGLVFHVHRLELFFSGIVDDIAYVSFENLEAFCAVCESVERIKRDSQLKNVSDCSRVQHQQPQKEPTINSIHSSNTRKLPNEPTITTSLPKQ
jgi:hypothetical protein